MSIHFRDDVEHGNDATLRVVRGGMRGGAVVRIDLHADKRRGGYLSFSLTPKEVEMLRAELLPERVAMPPAECFHGDHVPGCEHGPLATFFDALTADVPPPHEPWCPMFHARTGCTCGAEPGADPLDDPHGAREPAFGD